MGVSQHLNLQSVDSLELVYLCPLPFTSLTSIVCFSITLFLEFVILLPLSESHVFRHDGLELFSQQEFKGERPHNDVECFPIH